VNGGDPYGFILTPDPTYGRSGVSIQREIIPDTGETSIFIFFSILLADDLSNPDGSDHTQTRAEMYAMLLDYLEQSSELCIETVLGTWLGIGTIGHSATELHLIKGSMISMKLANISDYRPPVDSDTVFYSIWQGSPLTDDALTWETSVWR
jgi:hypothetical protein